MQKKSYECRAAFNRLPVLLEESVNDEMSGGRREQAKFTE